MARSSTSFQPGTSGNPGGRPKGLSEVIALAREHTELAITTLVDIAKQTKAAPAARVAAASALLDRGWGKPAQAIQATTTNASAVVMLDKGDPVEIAEHYRRIRTARWSATRTVNPRRAVGVTEHSRAVGQRPATNYGHFVRSQ